MEKAETKDRIKYALELRNMRQSELVEKTGIDKGQMSSYLSGKYKPRQRNLHLIANVLSVDEAWLMGYDVPMERVRFEDLSKTQRERDLLTAFKKLNDDGKDKVIEYTNDLIDSPKYSNTISTPAPSILMAAHNDNADDPEELKKIQRDLKMLKKIDEQKK
ncbi:helix-turn-helix domain-containing protein [Cuneatibacter sp. NSJ-177]|uniref:helix-turn-helix domain-containing protein n=1 Tax=Cuneatibacter sp. NSJ-177 TaxID=2931401 RepID=UPI001FD2B1D5|nr:helix-turn-helix transcriptional regulator [Cuneatibacter sp. NSJ-177]MCJ7834595.1 helix-turn-helix domain-containing protein [Cuneatibacter sp. NSJ-177]